MRTWHWRYISHKWKDWDWISRVTSGEIIFDEYIHFDAETVTSEPAVDPKQADWRQECCSKKNGIKIRRYCFNQRLGRLNCWWLTRY